MATGNTKCGKVSAETGISLRSKEGKYTWEKCRKMYTENPSRKLRFKQCVVSVYVKNHVKD